MSIYTVEMVEDHEKRLKKLENKLKKVKLSLSKKKQAEQDILDKVFKELEKLKKNVLSHGVWEFAIKGTKLGFTDIKQVFNEIETFEEELNKLKKGD